MHSVYASLTRLVRAKHVILQTSLAEQVRTVLLLIPKKILKLYPQTVTLHNHMPKAHGCHCPASTVNSTLCTFCYIQETIILEIGKKSFIAKDCLLELERILSPPAPGRNTVSLCPTKIIAEGTLSWFFYLSTKEAPCIY